MKSLVNGEIYHGFLASEKTMMGSVVTNVLHEHFLASATKEVTRRAAMARSGFRLLGRGVC
jgi:hypothetical protein